MKRTIALVMAALMLLALCACGSSKTSGLTVSAVERVLQDSDSKVNLTPDGSHAYTCDTEGFQVKHYRLVTDSKDNVEQIEIVLEDVQKDKIGSSSARTQLINKVLHDSGSLTGVDVKAANVIMMFMSVQDSIQETGNISMSDESVYLDDGFSSSGLDWNGWTIKVTFDTSAGTATITATFNK